MIFWIDKKTIQNQKNMTERRPEEAHYWNLGRPGGMRGATGRGGRVKNPPGLTWQGLILKKKPETKKPKRKVQHAALPPEGGAADRAPRIPPGHNF